jgi:hypothetical protein
MGMTHLEHPQSGENVDENGRFKDTSLIEGLWG